jgi:hypothetical protein
MEAWLKRTGRWFKSGADERWRKMLADRCSRNE